MKRNFLTVLITILSLLSILIGLIIMEICRQYWQASMQTTVAGSIILFSGAFMFVGGIIALATYHKNRTL